MHLRYTYFLSIQENCDGNESDIADYNSDGQDTSSDSYHAGLSASDVNEGFLHFEEHYSDAFHVTGACKIYRIERFSEDGNGSHSRL